MRHLLVVLCEELNATMQFSCSFVGSVKTCDQSTSCMKGSKNSPYIKCTSTTLLNTVYNPIKYKLQPFKYNLQPF